MLSSRGTSILPIKRPDAENDVRIENAARSPKGPRHVARTPEASGYQLALVDGAGLAFGSCMPWWPPGKPGPLNP